mgnify:CR=1 FL=1
MLEIISERKEAWKTIVLFLVLVVVLTSPFHYAIVNLYPSRIYVGAIMWCPAIAAFITLKIKGRKISSLHWNWGNWKYIRWSYVVPALYGLITYVLIWIFGFGKLANSEAITEWGGFFIYELKKVLSFTGVSIFSGLIWSFWHWPLLVYYSNNVLLEFTTFTIVIVSMSFIMTYYTFKSNSVWPAVIFHAVSNVYIQKILPELTIKNEGTEHWLGENGIMFAIVTCIFGIYFWRKAIKEKL